MKKERYEEAEMELILFDGEDIITSSCTQEWHCPNELPDDSF